MTFCSQDMSKFPVQCNLFCVILVNCSMRMTFVR